MKVFIVFGGYDYEMESVLGVYDSEEVAKLEVGKAEESGLYDYCFVDEEDVELSNNNSEINTLTTISDVIEGLEATLETLEKDSAEYNAIQSAIGDLAYAIYITQRKGAGE